MNTANQHIGNLLFQMSEKDVKEVFKQYAHKLGFDKFDVHWEISMSHWIHNILMCNHFDNDGNSVLVDDDIKSDEYWDKFDD